MVSVAVRNILGLGYNYAATNVSMFTGFPEGFMLDLRLWIMRTITVSIAKS